jgi:hypothetical protein
MDRVKKNSFTGYNAPSSEPFTLQGIGLFCKVAANCESTGMVWGLIKGWFQKEQGSCPHLKQWAYINND